MRNIFHTWLSRFRTLAASSEGAQNEFQGQVELSARITVLADVSPGRDREALKRLAKFHRWQMLFANNQAEAAQVARRHCVPIVLFERKLLGPDWEDLLRAVSKHSCVVLISPIADDNFWEKVIRQGGYDVLTTPLEDSDVVETVQFAYAFWKACFTGISPGRISEKAAN
jgi:FixJ family two-component response regulator